LPTTPICQWPLFHAIACNNCRGSPITDTFARALSTLTFGTENNLEQDQPMRRSSKRHPSKAKVETMPEPALFQGGRYRPLSDDNCSRIIDAAFSILNNTGIGGTPDWLTTLLLERGAKQRKDGRVTFPQHTIERALKLASHRVSLPGFDENKGLDIGNSVVHVGTGGAAVQTLDAASGEYRDSTLDDLYNMMRVLDPCDSVHYGIRPMIARRY